MPGDRERCDQLEREIADARHAETVRQTTKHKLLILPSLAIVIVFQFRERPRPRYYCKDVRVSHAPLCGDGRMRLALRHAMEGERV